MILTLMALLLAQAPRLPHTDGNPALRPETRALKSLVGQGVTRSVTFRDLVASFDASELLVYVRDGLCAPRVHACTQIHETDACPIVVITVDPFDRSPDTLIALLAHELQHAREIDAAHADGHNDRVDKIRQYYQRHGFGGHGSFETAEAVRITRVVQKELAAGR